jgi:hypothetical protein
MTGAMPFQCGRGRRRGLRRVAGAVIERGAVDPAREATRPCEVYVGVRHGRALEDARQAGFQLATLHHVGFDHQMIRVVRPDRQEP